MDLKPLENGLQEDLRNEGAEYEVQKIVGEVEENGVILYRIRWKGYGIEADTWEPYGHLNGCEPLIQKWNIKQERKREKAFVLEQEKLRKNNGVRHRGPGRPPNSVRQQRQGSDSDSVSREDRNWRKRSRSDSEPNVATTFKKSTRTSPSEDSSSSLTSSKIQAVGSDTGSDVEVISARTLPKDITRNHPDRLRFLAKLKTIPGPVVTIVNTVDDVPCPPLSFNFIDSYLLREGVPVPDPNAMWGCTCKGIWGCPVKSPELCECTEFCHPDNRIFAYTFGGRLRLRDNSQFAIHECNERCTCGIRCPNRVVGNGRTIKLEIFKTANKGWGLRSPDFIKAGAFIDKYVGEVVTPEEADKRMVDNDSRGLSYLFDLDKFKEEMGPNARIYTVDGGDYGGVTRFINHSCDPNLLIYAVTKNRSSLEIYDIALFSRRDIAPGEELTFQYTHSEEVETAENAAENEGKAKWPCYCGADNCKGFLW